MDSQEGVEHFPTAEDIREIEECNKIVEFHNLIVSGKHPTIKLIPPQLVRHNGAPPAPIEPVKVPQAALQSELLRTLERLGQMSTSSSKAAPKSFKASERLCSGFIQPSKDVVFESFKPAERMEPRSIPTCRNVLKTLQPSQVSTPPPLQDFTKMDGPPASQSNTSRLNYTRDYYRDLDLPLTATKSEICSAFGALKPANPKQQDAYQILSDDYLREVYDDARAFAFNVASLDEVLAAKQPELEPETKKPTIDYNADYYRLLGVQPGHTTTLGSIKRAFRHKISVIDPKNPKCRRRSGRESSEKQHQKLDIVREAYAVLSNYELRKQYDSGQVVPKTSRPRDANGRDRGRGKDRPRREPLGKEV